MDFLIEEYFKLYSSFAPDLFNNDNWALLFLLTLFGLLSQLAVKTYFLLFNKIQDTKKRIKILTTSTAVVSFFIFSGHLWIEKKLDFVRVVACFLLAVFIWSLQFIDRFFGKDFVIDFKSDLKLKKQDSKKGLLQCPGCSSYTIASLNIAHCSQTCGECERVIYLDKSYSNIIQYLMAGYGLLILTFLFMKFSLIYWNVFLNWLFAIVFLGGILVLAIYPERLKARGLKIKGPS